MLLCILATTFRAYATNEAGQSSRNGLPSNIINLKKQLSISDLLDVELF